MIEAAVPHAPPSRLGRPLARAGRSALRLLRSSRLAMALLVAILVCCLLGVTLLRGERAWQAIFSTLWFNGLLVLLVVNTALCFFGRIARRKLTLVTAGMILFHLSFVAIFAGVVYNSLCSFEGVMRLSEGESVANDDPASYDSMARGRFFDRAQLEGATTLHAMKRGLVIDGQPKRVGYDVEVRGESHARDIIYATHCLDYDGLRFFNDKEGYSLLIVLHDELGKELYGAVVSLQSLKQADGTYHYTTGTRAAPASFAFPQAPVPALFSVQLAYFPNPEVERGGDVALQIRPHANDGAGAVPAALTTARVPVGGTVAVGDYRLEVREVRYWVGMKVRRDPGQHIVLGSLWVAMAGIVVTFIGRIRQGARTAGAGRHD